MSAEYQRLTTDDQTALTKPDYNANHPPPSAPSDVPSPRSFSVTSVLEILVFFVAGCATAILHHLFYRYLSNKPVNSTRTTPFHGLNDQKWASRIGTALAIATKFLFAKAVGAAYVQRLWTVARRTGGVSLDGLDAGFDILNNPMGFLCWDLISSAQRLILLALMSWAMPFIAVVAPGALLVVPHNTTTSISSCAVPSVDLSTWASSAALSLYTNDSMGDSYLASPSPQMQQVATLALLSGTYAVFDPPQGCGPVCIYNISFFAPYFNCTDPYDIGNPSTSDSGGVYFWNATSVVNSPHTPDQFYIEWYGDRQATISGSSPNSAAQRVICSAINATYTFHVHHNGSDCLITSQSVTPVNNFSTIYNSTNGMLENPANPGATVYAAIFQSVTSILNGTVLNGSQSTSGQTVSQGQVVADGPLRRQVQIASPQDGYAIYPDSISWFFSLQTNQTMVTLGKFGHMNETAREWIPFSNIGQIMESLMYNVSIGLAALNVSGSPAPETTCTQGATENIYSYRSSELLVPYTVACICTLFSVLVGIHALWSNQSQGTTGFKTTLEVTRNPDLDVVVFGGVGKNGKRVRLKFVDFGVDGKPRGVFEVEPDSTAGMAI